MLFFFSKSTNDLVIAKVVRLFLLEKLALLLFYHYRYHTIIIAIKTSSSSSFIWQWHSTKAVHACMCAHLQEAAFTFIFFSISISSISSSSKICSNPLKPVMICRRSLLAPTYLYLFWCLMMEECSRLGLFSSIFISHLCLPSF